MEARYLEAPGWLEPMQCRQELAGWLGRSAVPYWAWGVDCGL